MRILVNRHIRNLLLTVTAVLLIYALLMQFLCGEFSLPILLLSLVASAAILLLCVVYLKKQDRLIDDAAKHIKRFLSGQRDERIECNEEGELFYLFQEVNTLSAVLNAQTEREKQTNEFLKSTISDISHQLKTPLSALNIYNELISDTDNMEDARHFASASETEIDRMDELVKNLLKLTRLDAGDVHW